MGAAKYPFAGKFDTSGMASNQIPRLGNTTLALTFLMTDADSNHLTGSVGDGTWTADLLANRSVFSTNHPAPFAGKYTIEFPGTNGDPQLPGLGARAHVHQCSGRHRQGLLLAQLLHR